MVLRFEFKTNFQILIFLGFSLQKLMSVKVLMNLRQNCEQIRFEIRHEKEFNKNVAILEILY